MCVIFFGLIGSEICFHFQYFILLYNFLVDSKDFTLCTTCEINSELLKILKIFKLIEYFLTSSGLQGGEQMQPAGDGI